MYVVYKKEVFKEEDTDTVFSQRFNTRTYEEAILLAAYEVLKHIYENAFLHSKYGTDDLHYLLSEDPKKILAWLTDVGSSFFEPYNMDFQVWVHLGTREEEHLDEIRFEDLQEISNRLQKRLLGKSRAEG